MIACANAQRTIFSVTKLILISPVSVVTAVSVWHPARIKLLMLLIFIVEIARIHRRCLVQLSVAINRACSLQWKFWHVINIRILCGRMMHGLILLLLLVIIPRRRRRRKWRGWCDDDSITGDGNLNVNLMLGG